MLYIKSLEQAVPVFKALGSELRIRLIQLLIEHKEMNMNDLAANLGITNGALTSHVKSWRKPESSPFLPNMQATETRKSVVSMLIKFW